MMVLLSKYLNNLFRIPKILFINCKINIILTLSANCFIMANTISIDGQVLVLAMPDTKLCVPVLILSTQDNAKLLEHSKSGFKRAINWNKYQSKAAIQAQNQYLDYIIDPSFQGVNRLFIFSFENNAHLVSFKQYFLSAVEIKDYVMVDGKKNLHQPVKKDQRTYRNIHKITTGQGDDYTANSLLDYVCFKNYYKMISI